MKAKEMAERYKQAEDKKQFAEDLMRAEFLEPTKNAVHTQRGRTDHGFQSVMREYELKWQAFARATGDPAVNINGFRDTVVGINPDFAILFPTRKGDA